MDKDLKKLKEIYLDSDIDAEDYQDNLTRITEWEETIRSNQDFLSWQQSDISIAIVAKVKEAYKNFSMQLINDRTLTQEQRNSIYAKQDAMLWIMSMIVKDAKSELETIHSEIKSALKVE